MTIAGNSTMNESMYVLFEKWGFFNVMLVFGGVSVMLQRFLCELTYNSRYIYTKRAWLVGKTWKLRRMPTYQLSHEEHPGYLLYIWDYTTQLYRDYNKPL